MLIFIHKISQASTRIRRIYFFFTFFSANIPYIWLILKGIYHGKIAGKIKKSWGASCLFEFFYSIAAIPAWTVVGAILFSTKLICVAAVCKLWWSMLLVYDVKYPSSSSGVNQIKCIQKSLLSMMLCLLTKKKPITIIELIGMTSIKRQPSYKRLKGKGHAPQKISEQHVGPTT